MRYAYFLAQGRSRDEILEIQRKQAAADRAKQEFLDKHGAASMHTDDDGTRAVIFKGDVPYGWRTRKDGTAVPNKRPNIGVEIARELRLLSHFLRENDDWPCPGPTLWGTVNGKRMTVPSTFEQWGDSIFIVMPTGDDGKTKPPTPLDAKPLTEAEYLALKEAAIFA